MFLYVRGSPEGSPPCRGRRAWVPRRPLKLCQREHRLLVGPPKPDRSKGRGPTKRDPPVLQFRGLGTGITTLSRKTPMLRKRQKKKAALRATRHSGHKWVSDAGGLNSSIALKETSWSLHVYEVHCFRNQTCPVFKIVNCVPRFSVTVGLKRLMKIYGVKPN